MDKIKSWLPLRASVTALITAGKTSIKALEKGCNCKWTMIWDSFVKILFPKSRIICCARIYKMSVHDKVLRIKKLQLPLFNYDQYVYTAACLPGKQKWQFTFLETLETRQMYQF